MKRPRTSSTGSSGTVFTLGDHAYPDGTAQEFTDCYEPSWGRHKARTMPVPGDNDYSTAGAPGYYGYLDRGIAAGFRLRFQLQGLLQL